MIFRPDDISLDTSMCLRAASSFNKCDECAKICPLNAISFKQDRPILDKESCVSCGACIGVCAPDALSLNSFNIPIFVVWASEQAVDKKLSCDEIGVCLGAFKSDYLSALALRLNAQLSVDISKCAKCEINKDLKVSSLIEGAVDCANQLLKSFDKSILVEKSASDDRRAFLKKIHSSQTLLQDFSGDIKQPAGRMLALALKEPNEVVIKSVKKIAPNLCTNCNDCVVFCPTNALESVNDGQSILHRPIECIECAICENVCTTDAIFSERVALNDWVRSRILVSFETKKCDSCGTLFSSATNASKCDGCGVFLEAFPDMFKTAGELEN